MAPTPADAVPLDDLVRELGPLPGPLAAEFGRQTADALRAAHEWGRTHGGVRPDGLLVGPVVTREYPDGSTRRRPARGAVVVLGDPGPGGGDGPSPADDLRDLGGTLYYLLTGRPPAADQPPLTALRPDLPPGFAGLVQRLLDPGPTAPPATAAWAADALGEWADRPAAPAPAPDEEPAGGWAADPFPSSPDAPGPGRPAARRVRTAGEMTRIGVLLALGLVLNLAAVGLAVAWWSGALDPKPETPPEPPAKAPPPAATGKRPDRGAYRYVRYLAPDRSWGNIAEFEVYGTPPAGGWRLAGEVIGTDGAWGDSDRTRDRVFDGDLETFFDAPDAAADRAWVGLDLGSAHVLTQIKFAPRPMHADRMVGGRFQASNTADFSAVVELYTVTTAPAEGVLTARTVGPGRGRKPEPDPESDAVRD